MPKVQLHEKGILQNQKRNRRSRARKSKRSGPLVKHLKQGDADFSDLQDIFKSIGGSNVRNQRKKRGGQGMPRSNRRGNTRGNTRGNKQGNGASGSGSNLQTIRQGLNHIKEAKTKRGEEKTEFDKVANELEALVPMSKKEKRKFYRQQHRDDAARQLQSVPNILKIPRCSMCLSNMFIERGDRAYPDAYTASCDYCGRDDIHGEIWHCRKCKNKGNGFDLCKTCGYLITRGRQKEIRRVAPPEDDLGLLFNTSSRRRETTLDGFTIYKHDEIQKTLEIGMGGNTKWCPFDCQCCH